jgi:hypothetical protein
LTAEPVARTERRARRGRSRRRTGASSSKRRKRFDQRTIEGGPAPSSTSRPAAARWLSASSAKAMRTRERRVGRLDPSVTDTAGDPTRRRLTDVGGNAPR